MNSGGTTLKNYKCGIQFFCENVRKYFELQDNSDRKEIETGWKSDNCMVNRGSTLLNNCLNTNKDTMMKLRIF